MINKKVVITGGSSGIGKQFALDCLKAGAKVIIIAEHREKLEKAKKELSSVSESIYAVHCDISDIEQVKIMVSKCIVFLGEPDILVNNAGFAIYKTFEESSLEEIIRLLNVNLLGHMLVTNSFLPHMIKNGGGNIVNIASVAGKINITPNAVYCGAKHGIVGWSAAIKCELKRFGINVNVILPGRCETAFFDHETFQKRSHRKETEDTVSVEKISQTIMKAILKNKFMTFVPKKLGFVSWSLEAFAVVLKPIMDRMMVSRIEDIYNQKQGIEDE